MVGYRVMVQPIIAAAVSGLPSISGCVAQFEWRRIEGIK